MQYQQITIAVGALAGVLALIWILQRILRSGAMRPLSAGRLRVVQSVALDPRRRVVLLQCDGAEVLVLTGGPADLLLSAPITLGPNAGHRGQPA